MSYLNSKKIACQKVGIDFCLIQLSDSITRDVLIERIRNLNSQDTVDSILVQLPLPSHLSSDLSMIISTIDPSKDVDGLTPTSLGKFYDSKYDSKYDSFCIPCTPQGIMELLNAYGIGVSGKDVVIVGRSSIVGKPLSHLMMEQDATVTVCHSKTQNLFEHTRRADLVVSAIGKANFFGKNDFKQGAVVIDVGINRDSSNKLCGDVRFNELENCSSISPVPGGVGPMTVLCLVKNIIKLAEIHAPKMLNKTHVVKFNNARLMK